MSRDMGTTRVSSPKKSFLSWMNVVRYVTWQDPFLMTKEQRTKALRRHREAETNTTKWSSKVIPFLFQFNFFYDFSVLGLSFFLRTRCQSSWGCHSMLWKTTRRKRWRRTWRRRRCSERMGWRQAEAPWAQWGASVRCRTVGRAASRSWAGCRAGRVPGRGHSLETGWVGRGTEPQKRDSTRTMSTRSAGRDQWNSVYECRSPMAGQMYQALDILMQWSSEVVYVLFDPEIQNLSKYHMCCSLTQAARLWQLICCFQQEIIRTKLVSNEAFSRKDCIGENMNVLVK